MPEFYVQTCYAVLTTLAIALAIVTYVSDNTEITSKWHRKPFTCMYCMTVWVSLAVCIGVWDYPTYFIMAPIVHILAYIIYQKAV